MYTKGQHITNNGIQSQNYYLYWCWCVQEPSQVLTLARHNAINARLFRSDETRQERKRRRKKKNPNASILNMVLMGQTEQTKWERQSFLVSLENPSKIQIIHACANRMRERERE